MTCSSNFIYVNQKSSKPAPEKEKSCAKKLEKACLENQKTRPRILNFKN